MKNLNAAYHVIAIMSFAAAVIIEVVNANVLIGLATGAFEHSETVPMIIAANLLPIVAAGAMAFGVSSIVAAIRCD